MPLAVFSLLSLPTPLARSPLTQRLPTAQDSETFPIVKKVRIALIIRPPIADLSPRGKGWLTEHVGAGRAAAVKRRGSRCPRLLTGFFGYFQEAFPLAASPTDRATRRRMVATFGGLLAAVVLSGLGGCAGGPWRLPYEASSTAVTELLSAPSSATEPIPIAHLAAEPQLPPLPPPAAASGTARISRSPMPSAPPAAETVVPVQWQSGTSPPTPALSSDGPPDASAPAPLELLAPPGSDGAPPPLRQELRFPDPAPADGEGVQISSNGERITIKALDASLDGVLAMIAQQQGLNIVSGGVGDQRISVTLHDVLLDDAFNAILAAKGYTWARHNDIVMVSSLSGEKQSAAVQGREVRVYNLNYVMATDVEAVVKGLLSPVGQAFITQTNPTEQRQTHEQIVVEDLPSYLQRVEAYLQQADIPPRQVLVQAYVLQVALEDNLRHGVNLDHLLRLSNTDVSLESSGFAADQAPTTVLRVQGHDLDGLIEAIKGTTDAKTLASPKVAVLNGQQARMQVGGQIGYLLTTTTQTSTLQSVNFLDVGVILTVTPIITDDQQILMQVRPEVSTGRINATTQLPESETTEVETKVMLADGEAMVIGGLIQETDNDSQNKIPLLGDVHVLGRLFQRRETKRLRNEIIIALLPRIISDVPGCRVWDPTEVDRARTPLLHGPLHENQRRMWEPELPDASR